MIYNARLIYKNGSKYAVYYSYGAEGDRNSAVVICQYVALLQLIKPLHTDGKKGELVIEIPSCFVEDMENPMVDLEINGFPIQAQEICFRILRKDTIEVESYAYKKHLQNMLLSDISRGKESEDDLHMAYYPALQKVILDWCNGKIYKKAISRVLLSDSYKHYAMFAEYKRNGKTNSFVSTTAFFSISFQNVICTYTESLKFAKITETYIQRKGMWHYTLECNPDSISAWIVNRFKGISNDEIERKAKKFVSDNTVITTFLNYIDTLNLIEGIERILLGCRFNLQLGNKVYHQLLIYDFDSTNIEITLTALKRIRETTWLYDVTQYDFQNLLRGLSKYKLMGKDSLILTLVIDKDFKLLNILIKPQTD